MRGSHRAVPWHNAWAGLVLAALVTGCSGEAALEPGGPAGRIGSVSGNNQTGVVGATLSAPLQVRVADRFGTPLPGVPVTFTVISGGGSIDGASAVSDLLGIATSGAWTLGPAPGGQQVRAEADGLQAIFDAFACGDACRGRQLLFVRNERIDGLRFGSRIYTLVDGEATPLTGARPRTGAFADAPAWSPDGRRIAFVGYDLDIDDAYQNLELYLMDADGSHVMRRATGFHSPDWSPDGRWLAVTGGESLSDIYRLSVEDDGAPPVHLASHAVQPAWAPDGSKIAFVALGDDNSLPELAVMNPDGSAITVVTPAVDGGIFHPTWSPDGQRIAYSKCTVAGCSIHAVNADGSGAVQLTTGDGSASAWSPDGAWIAFAKEDGIFYIAADGSSGEPIPMASPGHSPAWRP